MILNYKDEIKEMFDSILRGCGTNGSRVASMIIRDGKPMVRQSLFKMVKGGSLRVDTLLRILDMLDLEIKIEKGNEVIYGRSPKF